VFIINNLGEGYFVFVKLFVKNILVNIYRVLM